jgi:hypothetical protein
MSIICTQCSHVNPDGSTFCVGCGNRLSRTGQAAGNQFSSADNMSVPTFVHSPGTAPHQPSYAQTAAPPYPAPSNPPISSTSTPVTGVQRQWSAGVVAPPPPLAQIGSTQGMASIRRAFAGRGKLIMHHSWLLHGDNAYAHSGAVQSFIINTLRQRQIVGLSVNPEKLMERGVVMEEREYTTVHRSICTVFVYAAPAGQDLYISRATTALPAISTIRVIIVSIFAFIMFVGWLQLASLFSSPLRQFNPVGAALALLSFPICFFLLVLLIWSFISWVVEKDFLAYFRFNTLNDFQIDDVAMLEQIVDDTLRNAVQDVGLDASKVTSPTSVQSYQGKNRLRLI